MKDSIEETQCSASDFLRKGRAAEGERSGTILAGAADGCSAPNVYLPHLGKCRRGSQAATGPPFALRADVGLASTRLTLRLLVSSALDECDHCSRSCNGLALPGRCRPAEGAAAGRRHLLQRARPLPGIQVVCCPKTWRPLPMPMLMTLTRAAELLNSFPDSDDDDALTDVDSPMSGAPPHTPNPVPKDATELRLEARETHKYLLAKTFFDCREYDRCAALFLPTNVPQSFIQEASPPSASSKGKGKGKATEATPTKARTIIESVQGLSQKALFLALYSRYLAGERRANEDSEVILGPRDGSIINKELQGVSEILEEWFASLPSSGRQPQGWLEYLYGVVLAKGKNEKLAKDYIIQSVHQYAYNWAAWQELNNLTGSTEEVGSPMYSIDLR